MPGRHVRGEHAAAHPAGPGMQARHASQAAAAAEPEGAQRVLTGAAVDGDGEDLAASAVGGLRKVEGALPVSKFEGRLKRASVDAGPASCRQQRLRQRRLGGRRAAAGHARSQHAQQAHLLAQNLRVLPRQSRLSQHPPLLALGCNQAGGAEDKWHAVGERSPLFRRAPAAAAQASGRGRLAALGGSSRCSSAAAAAQSGVAPRALAGVAAVTSATACSCAPGPVGSHRKVRWSPQRAARGAYGTAGGWVARQSGRAGRRGSSSRLWRLAEGAAAGSAIGSAASGHDRRANEQR